MSTTKIPNPSSGASVENDSMKASIEHENNFCETMELKPQYANDPQCKCAFEYAATHKLTSRELSFIGNVTQHKSMNTTNESESTPICDRSICRYTGGELVLFANSPVIELEIARKLELELTAALKREAAWKKCAEGLVKAIPLDHFLVRGCKCKICKAYITFTELTKAK